MGIQLYSEFTVGRTEAPSRGLGRGGGGERGGSWCLAKLGSIIKTPRGAPFSKHLQTHPEGLRAGLGQGHLRAASPLP